MTVGIVTVTYNSASVLEEFFDSLFAQDHADFVLYVVDNASRDATRTAVEARAGDPRVRPIWNDDNTGIARGNNIGIERALADGCDQVLLLNNDTVFGPGLLSGLRRALAAVGADMVVPKTYYHDAPTRIWCAGGALQRWRGYNVRHHGFGAIDRGHYDRPRRIDYAPTCCLLAARSVFERVGLMDEKFFVYCDDTDFCIRARRAGVSMWYVPEPVLWHKVSSLTGGTSDFSLRMLTRGRTYLMRKHAPAWTLPYHYTALHLEMMARMVVKGERPKDFRARERGFREGLGIPLAAGSGTHA
jgi:GT2 family glycosyltransferase